MIFSFSIKHKFCIVFFFKVLVGSRSCTKYKRSWYTNLKKIIGILIHGRLDFSIDRCTKSKQSCTKYKRMYKIESVSNIKYLYLVHNLEKKCLRYTRLFKFGYTITYHNCLGEELYAYVAN